MPRTQPHLHPCLRTPYNAQPGVGPSGAGPRSTAAAACSIAAAARSTAAHSNAGLGVAGPQTALGLAASVRVGTPSPTSSFESGEVPQARRPPLRSAKPPLQLQPAHTSGAGTSPAAGGAGLVPEVGSCGAGPSQRQARTLSGASLPMTAAPFARQSMTETAGAAGAALRPSDREGAAAGCTTSAGSVLAANGPHGSLSTAIALPPKAGSGEVAHAPRSGIAGSVAAEPAGTSGGGPASGLLALAAFSTAHGPATRPAKSGAPAPIAQSSAPSVPVTVAHAKKGRPTLIGSGAATAGPFLSIAALEQPSHVLVSAAVVGRSLPAVPAGGLALGTVVPGADAIDGAARVDCVLGGVDGKSQAHGDPDSIPFDASGVSVAAGEQVSPPTGPTRSGLVSRTIGGITLGHRLEKSAMPAGEGVVGALPAPQPRCIFDLGSDASTQQQHQLGSADLQAQGEPVLRPAQQEAPGMQQREEETGGSTEGGEAAALPNRARASPGEPGARPFASSPDVRPASGGWPSRGPGQRLPDSSAQAGADESGPAPPWSAPSFQGPSQPSRLPTEPPERRRTAAGLSESDCQAQASAATEPDCQPTREPANAVLGRVRSQGYLPPQRARPRANVSPRSDGALILGGRGRDPRVTRDSSRRKRGSTPDPWAKSGNYLDSRSTRSASRSPARRRSWSPASRSPPRLRRRSPSPPARRTLRRSSEAGGRRAGPLCPERAGSEGAAVGPRTWVGAELDSCETPRPEGLVDLSAEVRAWGIVTAMADGPGSPPPAARPPSSVGGGTQPPAGALDAQASHSPAPETRPRLTLPSLAPRGALSTRPLGPVVPPSMPLSMRSQELPPEIALSRLTRGAAGGSAGAMPEAEALVAEGHRATVPAAPSEGVVEAEVRVAVTGYAVVAAVGLRAL